MTNIYYEAEKCLKYCPDPSTDYESVVKYRLIVLDRHTVNPGC